MLARFRSALILAVTLGALAAGASASAAASLPTLTITATSSSISVAGAEQSGAVNVVTEYTGSKEANVILVQLRPGASFEQAEAAIQKAHGDTNAVGKYGSIVFDGEALAGKEAEAQIVLAPGPYVAVLPGGEGKGSKAHADFTVGASPSPAALPAPEATIKAIEFGFKGPSTLRDGELVRFENAGYLVHMNVAAPVRSLKAARLAIKALLAGKEKALEKLISGPPVGFTGPVSPEAFQQETITAKPGIYFEVCFMDTQDGRSHAQLGMERIIKIVK